MSGGFRADPAALVRHAAEFPALADRAGAIHGELAAALAAAGDCWGADVAGRGFAQVHGPAADATVDQLAALPGLLREVGDRFAATASGFRTADEHGADVIDGRP